jgi:hypothetical protein
MVWLAQLRLILMEFFSQPDPSHVLTVSPRMWHFCDTTNKPSAPLPKRIEVGTMPMDYKGLTI